MNDLVTRSISCHQTEQMQQHYSTVDGGEQRNALAKVISCGSSGGQSGGHKPSAGGQKLRKGRVSFRSAARGLVRATALAERALAEVDELEATFQYGNSVHHGHIILGRVALATGNVNGACTHLAAAGAIRGSPQLGSFGPDFKLAAALLAHGKRDAVVSYLDACKLFWDGRATALESWKKRIARGETPSFQTWSDDAVDD